MQAGRITKFARVKKVTYRRNKNMMIHCSFNWSALRYVAGSCMRPGEIALTEKAFAVCDLPADARIADIGCGVGGTLEYLDRMGICHPVGLDCSETFLKEAAFRALSARFVLGRAEILPFKKASFDALFCECVLSTLRDRITPLAECVRVLKEGGFLIISDVFGQGCSGQGLPDGKPQGSEAQGLLTKEGILALLEELGFSLLLWEEHEKHLKEFVARTILAGVSLQELQACRQQQEGNKKDRMAISYFLLVARKLRDNFQPKG